MHQNMTRVRFGEIHGPHRGHRTVRSAAPPSRPPGRAGTHPSDTSHRPSTAIRARPGHHREPPTSPLDGPSGPRCPISATEGPATGRQPQAAPIEKPESCKENPGRNRDTAEQPPPLGTAPQPTRRTGHGQLPGTHGRLRDAALQDVVSTTPETIQTTRTAPCTAATRHTRHTDPRHPHTATTTPNRNSTTPTPLPHTKRTGTDLQAQRTGLHRVASPASDHQDGPTGSRPTPLRPSRSDSATARNRARTTPQDDAPRHRRTHTLPPHVVRKTTQKPHHRNQTTNHHTTTRPEPAETRTTWPATATTHGAADDTVGAGPTRARTTAQGQQDCSPRVGAVIRTPPGVPQASAHGAARAIVDGTDDDTGGAVGNGAVTPGAAVGDAGVAEGLGGVVEGATGPVGSGRGRGGGDAAVSAFSGPRGPAVVDDFVRLRVIEPD
ncbi:hypothetical protein EHYA_07342 [Embleya hyalina]|uniref:Uncharacterized protein n=1 Tax=Embleya hyalina TaxID=516124 RepID=A0A401YYJ8_9ACTN|nr:hypothetical protein EHYA_07342 [Embleya hyalina]